MIYAHECYRCRVSPGEILLPGILVARFLWGGLSPVLNSKWLQWAGVTHVLNCLGSARCVNDTGHIVDPHHRLAMQARSPDDGIEYIDWCVNHPPSRRKYLRTFTNLEQILITPSACLYVHCKSGQDRSAMTIYALLRSRFGLSEGDAWNALQTRRAKDGWPCARWSGRGEITDWLDAIMPEVPRA